MKLKLQHVFWALALSFVSIACSDNDQERPRGAYESGILIMNEGSFGTNDGEVYHLNPETEELKADIFEAENNRPFAGLLEDLVLDGERLYLVANTGKVEIVNAGTFKSRGAVVGELDQPRSLAVNGNKLFISDYGPYDAAYNTPDSYIAVVNGLDGGAVTKKISVSEKPESLYSLGNHILVAGAGEGKIEIIDVPSEEVVSILGLEGSPRVFFEARGDVWVYAVNRESVVFYALNKADFAIKDTRTFPIPNATGRIAFGNDDMIYLLTSSGWPDYNDGVAKFSLFGDALEPNWITGSGFYGIGFDVSRRELYVANSNGFQGNGTIKVIREDGTETRSFDAGRGPSGFMFYGR